MAHPIRRVGLDSEGQERPWVEGSGARKLLMQGSRAAHAPMRSIGIRWSG